MAQLIMRWTNDGAAARAPVMPEGMTLATLPELEDGVYHWLDIVRFMEQEEQAIGDRAFYDKVMTARPGYDDKMCYFVLLEGAPVATITVICDYTTKAGYIHMVACKPACRGKGIGHLLNSIAVYALKKEGMETARLTTDDWRLAAIKTYLKAGFVPDTESKPDFKERWEKIMKAFA
ncbi:MAG: GNAT family N-acetyltransferase [Clostridia bacterium]|nr:GNAT family N-acetyltransferase [Clostridia bacterium]